MTLMSLWIPALRVGVGRVFLGLTNPSPVCCSLGRASGLQHYLINLGFHSHIFSDSREQSGPCQPFPETCESGGWKPEDYVSAWLPLASPS